MFSGITQGLEDVKNTIISSVGEAFQSVGQFILDGIRSFFVPDEDFLEEKINVVKEKFLFIDSIKASWESISNLVVNGEEEIPKIEIDLSNAETKYNYGGKVLALDLTWYSKFKPIVDNFIVAFSYISFVFFVFKRAPEIISGAGAKTQKEED